MRRGTWASLLFIVAVAAAGLALTIVQGKTPLLGLDLQGGASVVLRPKTQTNSKALEQAVNIIRQRVDGVGVAEPDVTQQGQDIIVQLPGVKDKDRILALVGKTAQLRFRPVIGTLPSFNPEAAAAAATSTTVAADPASPATPPATTGAEVPSTTDADDKAEATVILPDKDGTRRYQLGPSQADGTIISTASANAPAGVWQVDFELTASGSSKFDTLAAANLNKQVAIALDGEVQSAPTINTANFSGRGQITGSFTEREAKDLALVLRYGSLPVELETQTSQTVSATLGKDSLRAGVIAGGIGLGLVMLYMLLYYRALGLVVILGLGVSGALLYVLVTQLGFALSLSGATGVVVSVGVTVDSYIVYFERLKDEIRSGKSIRSSVDRGFRRAFKTILVADGTSFIGAAILYQLTVGPVRGFALTLALSTALDCIVAWFFTRPMVAILGRSSFFTEARFFGVARGLASPTVAVAT